MGINPIDFQVAIARTSEVSKITRVTQDQQQINQQLNDESVRLSLTAQLQSIQRPQETDQEELKNDDRSKKRNKKDDKERKKDDNGNQESSGGLDIKI